MVGMQCIQCGRMWLDLRHTVRTFGQKGSGLRVDPCELRALDYTFRVKGVSAGESMQTSGFLIVTNRALTVGTGWSSVAFGTQQHVFEEKHTA